ncbi:hypothetical protein LshimejAT787_1500210 [Lyophyllum shimeji]|uniref:Uncharacterized protein n=1 Tax=Lyophyllum shimeji TaxID=47721 RepID=A0A9P3PVQ7_LYOSH|nr:hypothetical protein LshimejAT787_1500210 [Lyophyllum shimeji]
MDSDDEPESDARPPAKRTRSQPLKPSKSGAAGASKGKKSAKVVESEEVEDDHTEEEVDEVEVEGPEDEEDEDDEDDDGLQPQHHASITAAVVTKDDMTKDLRTIFSDLLNVKFTKNGINSSSQQIEQFEKIQTDQCKLDVALKFKLHGNTRWGSAHGMLDRAFKLRQAIDLFISTADQLYGPITTIRQNGMILKKIPWSAFALTPSDWERVAEAQDILADSDSIQQYFSSERKPTLWRALPAVEDLLTKWDAKIIKYYNKCDAKPAYILALALHPYYKLDYIELAWGGEKEQKEDIAKEILDAKNWQDEARQVLEKAMGEYWAKRSRQEDQPQPAASSATSKSSGPSIISDFEWHRRKLVSREANERWEAELRRYLKDQPRGLVADMVGGRITLTNIQPLLRSRSTSFPATLRQFLASNCSQQASKLPMIAVHA